MVRDPAEGGFRTKALHACGWLSWACLLAGGATLAAALAGHGRAVDALAAAALGAVVSGVNYRFGSGRAAVAGLAGSVLLCWSAWALALRPLAERPPTHAVALALLLAPAVAGGLLLLVGVSPIQTRGAQRVRTSLDWLRAAWARPAGGASAARPAHVFSREAVRLPNVVLGRRAGAGGAPVVWAHRDRYRHGILFGPPGTGKTSRVLAPAILQDLLAIRAGRRLGLTVVEPKGDLAAAVAAAARRLGIPVVHIDPTRADSATFNPLVGPPLKVAESIRSVLRAMFGRQEAFFGMVQEETARNTVLLLKRLAGDALVLSEVLSNLQNPAKLRANVDRYAAAGGDAALVDDFRSGALSESLADKMHQFATGLRMQLGDLVVNRKVRRVLEGPSSIDLDLHLSQGGCVLAVGTGMGELSGRLGQLFGQLIVMSIQNAIFRRPGPEFERIPHALYIDEAPEFVNPEFARLLSMGRTYRASVFLALQNRQQLAERGGREFLETVLTNAQTRMIFGGLTWEDAKWFAGQFGRDRREERVPTYQREGMLTYPRSEQRRHEWRERFDYTQLMELPADEAVAQVLTGGRVQPAVRIRTDRVRWPQGVDADLGMTAEPGGEEDDPAPIGLATATEIAAAAAAGARGSRRRQRRSGGSAPAAQQQMTLGADGTTQKTPPAPMDPDGDGLDWQSLPEAGAAPESESRVERPL